jgi:hypothetical protein
MMPALSGRIRVYDGEVVLLRISSGRRQGKIGRIHLDEASPYLMLRTPYAS